MVLLILFLKKIKKYCFTRNLKMASFRIDFAPKNNRVPGK